MKELELVAPKNREARLIVQEMREAGLEVGKPVSVSVSSRDVHANESTEIPIPHAIVYPENRVTKRLADLVISGEVSYIKPDSFGIAFKNDSQNPRIFEITPTVIHSYTLGSC